jgi:hypothetical protein
VHFAAERQSLAIRILKEKPGPPLVKVLPEVPLRHPILPGVTPRGEPLRARSKGMGRAEVEGTP